MRTLPALVFLLATLMNIRAAQVQWNASATSPGSFPPAASYRVESAPVGLPAAATWTTYGTTTGTNIVITNNVYLMFRIFGVSAGGTESDPSNVVTNTLAKPAPPGSAIISASIESAPTPDGPWTVQATFPADVQLVGNQFYRGRLTLANGGTTR